MRLIYSLPIGLLAAALAAATPQVVDSKTGVSYTGLITTPGIETFLGIPYGKAERFAPPTSVVHANGTTINATVAGAACPQAAAVSNSYNSNVTVQSEDCLNLKVARPAGAVSGNKLPVMVYIYGGGLFSGFADERTTAPDGLIAESVENGTPVLFIAMNYRLNIFGFATTEALRADRSLNVGLKDQRLALEWVRDNIALFGGDPENIMIFGQSSGALSVTMQILAYGGSQGQSFQKAAIHSTALEPTMTSNISFVTYNAVAELAGCSNSSVDPQSVETLECLRALSWEDLFNYTNTQQTLTSSENDGDTYLPTVDQDFVPLEPSELVRLGMFTKMPVMMGWQENDATLFTSRTIETPNDTSAFVDLYWPDLNSTVHSQLLDLYPSTDFTANTAANLSSEFYRMAQIFRDILLTCPNFYFGAAMAQKYAEDDEELDNPVYLFVGNQTILDLYLDSVDEPGLGVIHTSDLCYVYGNLSLYNVSSTADVYNPSPSDYLLAKKMARSWSNFATTGKPSLSNATTLQGWESSYPNITETIGGGEGVDGAQIYVIGGLNEGMSALEGEAASEAVAAEKLRERCGFLNSRDVIAQLRY